MRITLLLFMAAVLCSAADKNKKKIITNEAGNDNLDITADPLITPEEIKTALGADLPPGIIAVRVKVVPKGDEALSISRDDFILLSHRDGQRSGPYSPSQIAGSTTMTVRTQSAGSGGIGRHSNGPIWGGVPGTMGRPRQVDDGSGMSGTAPSHETSTSATIADEKGKPENPLLKVLQAKMLPEKESTEPVEGLLYFPIDGKLKTKDLELIYQGRAGRLYVNFR